MNTWLTWAATLATVAVPAAYEAALWVARQRHPARVARWSHAGLRVMWLDTMAARRDRNCWRCRRCATR